MVTEGVLENKMKHHSPRGNWQTHVDMIAERHVLTILRVVCERCVFRPAVRKSFGCDDSCCLYCRKVKSTTVPCSRGDGTGGIASAGSACPRHCGLLLGGLCALFVFAFTSPVWSLAVLFYYYKE